ncbi:MAG: ubiquinone biosynthesis accessory factor UbiJ, partial [bacterium]
TIDGAIDALIDALNRAGAMLLETDPDGARNLARLRGKVFRLEITAPPLALFLLVTERGLAFRRESTQPPQVTLRGSALAFARLARRDASGNDASDGVRVHGDAELGQDLQQALRRLDLDWEELLARAIGDAPARKIGVALGALAEWAADSATLSRENLADYLREEKRVLATPLAMESFEHDVGQLRAEVDRMARRVERLRRALATKADSPARGAT